MRSRAGAALLALLAAAGCSSTGESRGSAAPTTPRVGLEIPASGAGGWTLEQLLTEYGRVTDQRLLLSEGTRAQVARTPLGFDTPLTVAPSELHAVVEVLLVNAGFALAATHDEGPRMVRVLSLTSEERTNARQHAQHVALDDVETWRAHPAFLISTVVPLEVLDAGALAGSMRSLLTDANTEVVAQVGDAAAVAVVGFGPRAADLVRMIREADRAESVRRAAPGFVQEAGH